MPALTRIQCREIDRRAIEEFGMSGLVLMENAGRGAADLLCRKMEEQHANEDPHAAIASSAVICCGKGNNGGDGFVIARHLDLRGKAVRVLVWAEPHELTGDAGVNFQILRRCGIPIEFASRRESRDLDLLLGQASWIVDCLLGTGARGEPRPPLDLAIDRINAAGARRFAVDVPSGLDCDSGIAAQHTIRADVTATFAGMKRGFLVQGAKRYTGEVFVLDIGAPRILIEQVLAVG